MGKSDAVMPLMSSRSAGSCVKAGFVLYADNFKKIFRASWIAALLYSVLFAVMGTLCVTELPRLFVAVIQTGGTEGVRVGTPLIAVVALSVLGGVAEVLFYSCGLSLLRGHSKDGTIARTAKWYPTDTRAALRTVFAALWTVAFTFVPSLLLALLFHFKLRFALLNPGGNIAWLVLATVYIVVVTVLLLPFIYILMKYVLDDGVKMTGAVAKGYPMALRRCPFIMAVMFVNLCVILLFSFVIQQPAIILGTASLQANIGLLYGDPLGMPKYITALTLGTFLLAGFIQAYIRMSLLFPTYYMYGSMESRENERLKAIEQINGKRDEESIVY